MDNQSGGRDGSFDTKSHNWNSYGSSENRSNYSSGGSESRSNYTSSNSENRSSSNYNSGSHEGRSSYNSGGADGRSSYNSGGTDGRSSYNSGSTDGRSNYNSESRGSYGQSRDSYGSDSRSSSSYANKSYGSSGSSYGNKSDSWSSRGRDNNYKQSWGNRGGQSNGYSSQGGDNWNCSSCGFANFPGRTACYKCQASKGNSGSSYRQNSDSSQNGQKRNYGGHGKSDYWNNDSRYGDRNSKGSSDWKQNNSRWNQKGDSENRSYGSNDYSDSPNKKKRSDGGSYTTSSGLIDWDALKADAAGNGLQKKDEKIEEERWSHLPELVKDVYVEDPVVKALGQEEVEAFREKSFNMTVRDLCSDTRHVPNPVRTFAEAFGPYPGVMAQIQRQGFETPTPIQTQSWPILMKGYDMIGIAQTGTGKTLAFLLPALLHIVAQPTPRFQRIGPTCLIIAPTRELAQQIEKEISKFNYEGIRCACVYGQGDKRTQIRQLNAMAEIVVATPGRLNDFAEQGIVNLNGVSFLVLDEADRMLDMGFEPQIRKIIVDIRPDRQTVMTSATWPKAVRNLAWKLMKDPIRVVVGSLDLQAVHTVNQQVIMCSEMDKKDKLLNYIKNLKHDDKAIVFVSRKSTVDDLSVELSEIGIYVQSMHGDRCQRDRERALSDLKRGRVNVLIATDVASRGIDVQDVTHILNYDCPIDMEEYVHRIGRTGRAGKTGEALTFFTRDDWKSASKMIDLLEKANKEVPQELFGMKKRCDRIQAERNQRNEYFKQRNTYYQSRW